MMNKSMDKLSNDLYSILCQNVRIPGWQMITLINLGLDITESFRPLYKKYNYARSGKAKRRDNKSL